MINTLSIFHYLKPEKAPLTIQANGIESSKERKIGLWVPRVLSCLPLGCENIFIWKVYLFFFYFLF